MGKCVYCGRWAGLFSSIHPECQEKKQEEKKHADEMARLEESAVVEILAKLHIAAVTGNDDDAIASLSKRDSEIGDLPQRVLHAWVRSFADPGSERGLPTEAEEKIAQMLIEKFGLSPGLMRGQMWERFCRLVAIRDAQNGRIHAINIAGQLPFILEPGERIAWVFPVAEYLEDKVVRSRSRGYSGVSMRVMPGLYVHTGQGAQAQAAEGFVHIDNGVLAFTDRALLFSGGHKAFRVKYKELASLVRYDYGFAACRNRQSARMFGFTVQDPMAGFPHGMLEALLANRVS